MLQTYALGLRFGYLNFGDLALFRISLVPPEQLREGGCFGFRLFDFSTVAWKQRLLS
jgi:hypothetical protein